MSLNFGDETIQNWDEALKYGLKKIDENLESFTNDFPSPCSTGNQYDHWENMEWTPGFWTGLIWLAYESTNENKYLESLKILLPTFKNRLLNDYKLDTHDIGFIYSLSLYPSVKLFENKENEKLLIKSADRLMQRYNETAGIIQAWGSPDDPAQQGRMIIDCLLNLPLLYTASKLSGNNNYYEAALSHAKQAQLYLVRDDYSSYHTYYMDPLTGKPLFGKTAQGVSDETTWARGQAWAVYGFALNYHHTGDITFLETAIKTADYYLEKLPDDGIPYWDLSLTEKGTLRDSSAGAILCCGLLEILQHLPLVDEHYPIYKKYIFKILNSLNKDYTTKDLDSNGILKHGIYSVPHKDGIDECCIWGDYFYFEALVRIKNKWSSYWK